MKATDTVTMSVTISPEINLFEIGKHAASLGIETLADYIRIAALEKLHNQKKQHHEKNH